MRTKIRAKWIIKMSNENDVLIKVGTIVKSGEKLAMMITKKIESFNFSQFLGKLSADTLVGLNLKFKNNWVNSGELMCLVGGVFPNKICFPMSGNFLEIDEFGNLKIEKVDDKKREVLAPVDSKVIKIEEDKIVLEFGAHEFKGIGLVEGKAWGEGKIKIIDEAKDLNFGLKGSVLFTKNLNKTFLLKAEVIGVMAVVTNVGDEGEIETELPVLKLEEKEWSELINDFKDKPEKMLVNSRLGRLLLVVE
ncbi:MAG: hypothetical protein WC895_00495 [Candidatus Shapirobacteria bacterium]|jgi:hypothetical protein